MPVVLSRSRCVNVDFRLLVPKKNVVCSSDLALFPISDLIVWAVYFPFLPAERRSKNCVSCWGCWGCCGGEQFAGSFHLLQCILYFGFINYLWGGIHVPGSSTLIQFASAWLRLYEFIWDGIPQKVPFIFFLFVCIVYPNGQSPCLFRRSLNHVCSCSILKQVLGPRQHVLPPRLLLLPRRTRQTHPDSQRRRFKKNQLHLRPPGENRSPDKKGKWRWGDNPLLLWVQRRHRADQPRTQLQKWIQDAVLWLLGTLGKSNLKLWLRINNFSLEMSFNSSLSKVKTAASCSSSQTGTAPLRWRLTQGAH